MKLTIKLIAILALTGAMLAETTDEKKNWCAESSRCGYCELLTDKTKSCTECPRGIVIDADTTMTPAAQQCTTENLPDNCIAATKTAAGAYTCDGGCEDGYYGKTDSATSVTTCHDEVETKVDNCAKYYWSSSESKVKCSYCEANYDETTNDSQVCVEVPSESKTVENCANYRYSTSTSKWTCSSCEEGYEWEGTTVDTPGPSSSQKCVEFEYPEPTEIEKMCRSTKNNEGKICTRCRTSASYYAVDVKETDMEQVCEYSTTIYAMIGAVASLAVFFRF